MAELLDLQELTVESSGNVVVDLPRKSDEISDTVVCFTHECEGKTH
jgi:hypothetical protein